MFSFLKSLLAYWRQENTQKMLKIIFGLAVITFMLVDGRRFLGELNFREIVRLLKQLSLGQIIVFFFGACSAVLMTALYDFTALYRNGNRLPLKKIVKTAWISNTFNNVAGFGGLGGAAIRLVLYKDVISEKEIHKINLQIIPAAITGLGVLMMVNLTGVTHIQPLMAQYSWLPLLMIGFISFVPIFCWFTDIKISKSKFEFSHIPNRQESITRVLLVCVSAFDWFLAVCVLWLVAHYFDSKVTILAMAGLFSVATSAGIASLIPGGVGSFDLMLIFGLKIMGLETNEAMAVLLLFRFFYYVVPLTIGAFMATGELANHSFFLKFKIWIAQLLHKPVDASLINEEPKEVNEFAIKSLYILTQLAALLLVVSSAIPDFLDRTKYLKFVFTLPVMQNAHRLAIIAGLLLALVVQEIPLQTRRAQKGVIVLLLIGAALTVVKGFNLEVGLFLLAVAILLFRLQSVFYRSSGLRRYISIFKALGYSMLLTGLYIYLGTLSAMSHVDAPKGFDILQFTSGEILMNGVSALVIAWLLYSVWLFKLQSPIIHSSEWEKFAELSNTELLEYPQKSPVSYLKDQLYYWTKNRKVLISYAFGSLHTFVLGDPIATEEYLQEGLREFEKKALNKGYPPIFYQVSERVLSVIDTKIHQIIPTSENGIVLLAKSESENVELNEKLNLLAEEHQLTHAILKAPHDEQTLAEFSKLHQRWLKGRIEKFLAVGWFNKHQLQHQEVCAVYKNGEMIAFAAIRQHESEKTVLMEWMRFDDEGVLIDELDYLFYAVFVYAHEIGFEQVDIGLAPLDIEEQRVLEHYETASSIMYYSNSIYRTVGDLRSYKERFKPNWEKRYMVIPNEVKLADALIEISMLTTVGHGLSLKRFLEE